ncbi:phospholipase A and acyltransferase 2-like [Montipora foliosa]|uniref:phospholipase A and acyltransferase 2-like n=1 Tax=Montipora foliosa TaxID=591990 RepID=UPI0035F206F3
MDKGFQQNLSISPVVKLKDLKPGDHVLVRRKIENLHRSLKTLYFITGEYYFHHGIYIGDDEVTDFGGETKETAKPRTVDILEFMKSSCDGKLYRVNEADEKTESGVREILKRALEMVNDPSQWPGYNLFWNNCESFANYLKTGKSYTEQGTKAIRIALAALAAGGGVGAVGSIGFIGK